MNLNDRINDFAKLGKELSQPSKILLEIIKNHRHTNSWFDDKNIMISIDSWSKLLTSNELNPWISKYNLKENSSKKDIKKIAIIMAGNIPMVGFHDFLSVLITGNKAIVKLSSKDNKLIPFMANFLINQNSDWANFIEFSDEIMPNFDAVIATGSNNSFRYFEYYFGKYPSILRKNRTSIAVLSGDESKEDLRKLADDILMYFGLGCRNVTKLYIPKGYDLQNIFESLFDYKYVLDSKNYYDNYTYHKTIYLMNQDEIWENGFFMLKENKSLKSPISCVFFEYYDDICDVEQIICENKDEIQCIVSNNIVKNSVDFGKAQMPKLDDYADDIDTIEFLTNL